MRICAYTLMPNHWHFLLWPKNTGDLGAFMQKLTITHVRNWQEDRGRVGHGHVYQGRYRSFPVEASDFFIHAAQYVEQNALRAGLVAKADEWRWSSLWRRVHGKAGERKILGQWPVTMPKGWRKLVNTLQPKEELEAVRLCVVRGRPYGSEKWGIKTATRLGLESAFRPRGRPRKVVSEDTAKAAKKPPAKKKAAKKKVVVAKKKTKEAEKKK
jgi:putative transposase